ncbi:FAD-dependent oxidoreductase [Weissella cibaria]|uniref:FAD-dependent oxidoreductase n=1 Tax=Weissella cibaria TaxID=137591 RepID=UPI001FA7F2D7|nr:FAD-dependent oxidoreductase [Weissella cibaria]
MAETLHYDVAIIGAGPAGLAAAEDIVAAGKTVVLIESTSGVALAQTMVVTLRKSFWPRLKRKNTLSF